MDCFGNKGISEALIFLILIILGSSQACFSMVFSGCFAGLILECILIFLGIDSLAFILDLVLDFGSFLSCAD